MGRRRRAAIQAVKTRKTVETLKTDQTVAAA